MELDTPQILKILPHRFPFLLIDKVLEVSEKRIVAIKNISVNEPFFTGHFPENPVFPGVLLIEACAQASGILLNSLYRENDEKQLGLFGRISNFSFKRIVKPGDVLVIESELLASKMSVYKFKVKATVGGEIAGLGEIEIILTKKSP